MLLQYSKWKKLLESSQPDAAYLRIDFNVIIDIVKKDSDTADKIFLQALDKVSAKFSDSCKIEKRQSSRTHILGADITVSLAEEEGFGFFAEAGVAEPQDMHIHFPFGIKVDYLEAFFIKWRKPVGNLEKKGPHTVLLTSEDYNKSESDLVIAFFDFFFEQRVYNNDTPKLTSELVDKALLSTDRSKKEKLLEDLTSAISAEVALQYCLDLPYPIQHRTVNLDEYSRETSAALDRLKEMAENISSASEEEKKEFVIAIVKLQSRLATAAKTGFVERKIAADRLVKSYDILDLSGLSEKEIESFL